MCFHIKTCFKNRSLTPFFQHGPLSRTRFSLMLVSFFTRRARDNRPCTVHARPEEKRSSTPSQPPLPPHHLHLFPRVCNHLHCVIVTWYFRQRALLPCRCAACLSRLLNTQMPPPLSSACSCIPGATLAGLRPTCCRMRISLPAATGLSACCSTCAASGTPAAARRCGALTKLKT